jgi:hypothetical protein
MNHNVKKPYTKPALQPCGTVEKITLEQNKQLGPTDGFLFNGNAIRNAS